jgi:PAS domain S-box-containing protein
VISVLHIDNDPVLLDMAKRFLERDPDIRVETSLSATDALHHLKTSSYDAIVTEYDVAAADGLHILRTIREHFPKIPCIFFTHKNRDDIIAEAFKSGAVHYIRKGGDQKSQFIELSHELRRAVEFRETERKIARLNRIDAILRRINEAVVHLHDRGQLAQEVCKILVQEGGFGLAWIGFEDPKKPRIETVFASGAVDDFFGKIRILSDDIKTGQGPSVTTIRKGKFTVCNDIQPPPDTQMWEADAIRKGFRSVASFPISTGKTTHGAITVYSGEKKFFTEPEIRLLNGISDEISYALRTLEMEEIHRQIEGELELSEHRLTEIINFLPEATFATDTEGTLIIWNKAMEKLTAISAEQVIGLGNYEYSFRILGERIPGLLDLVFAPDAEIEKYQYSAIRKTPGCVRAQLQVPALRGKPAALEVTASLLYDQNGQLSGAIESITDVREHNKTDEKFRQIFETADFGLLFLEPDTGKIIEANPYISTLTGHPHDSLLGRKPEETGLFRDAGLANQLSAELKKTDHTTVKDVQLVTKDGKTVNVDFYGRVTSNEGDQIIQWSVYPVTERERAENARKVARKNLDMFSSRIRHDILNQLMVVSGSLELASYGVQEPDLQKHLNRAQTATKTIQRQIIFTREFESLGEEMPSWQPVPRVIHHAFLEVETDSVSLNVQQKDLEVYADPLFEKVFYLLFNFSYKYGEKVTRIDVTYEFSSSGLIIVVSDNGVGIGPETKSQLFEWRPGNEKTQGLFLAQRILESTGLSIRETGEFAKGARFEIVVPPEAFRTGSSSSLP